jgi:radical SAM superfamily enzyme YgiQ (UPF0313 family)
MKVLIINSPLFREKNDSFDEDSLPPIGLGLIATALGEKGFDVELIDAVAQNIPLQELFTKVSEKEPTFICINIFTTNLVLVKEFIESIHFPVNFIIGGLSTESLFSAISSWSTKNPIYVVHGDGELITSDIISDHLLQAPTLENGNRRFFKIDNNSVYFVSDISKDKLNRSFFVNEPIKHPLGFNEACVITSRGCIFNCAFCAAARSMNKDFRIREKSTASIISEIDQLLNIYQGVDSIRVVDDLFLKNPLTITKASEVFNNFNLQWRSMAHIQSFKNVEDEKIVILKKSGCYELFIGIESGSPRILKQIHKTTDIDMIKENISKLLRNEINVKAYFVYGFPGETIEDFDMTFSLAEYLKNVSVKYSTRFRTSVFQFRPYHGTELYQFLKKQFGDDTFNKIASVKPNKELSKLLGRSQFNFQSGNYADADLRIVEEFIHKTTSLNLA